MSPHGPVSSHVVPRQRDDTTRYLCAAAHLDPVFADAAIREFLTEPLRAIPPSPAINAGAVLREAVAARARRRLRDALLLLILVAFAAISPVAAIAWVAVGMALAMFGGPTHAAASAGAGPAGRNAKLVVTIVGVVLLLLFVVLVGPQLLSVSPGHLDRASSTAADVIGPAEVALGFLALTVVLVDEFARSFLITRSFRRGTFVADPKTDSWPGERLARTLGSQRYQRELARVAAAEQAGNLVAYRGYEPFVGAGPRYEPFSMTIPLDPLKKDVESSEGDDRHPSFTLTELYDHVAGELLGLRTASTLSPSERLAGLTETVKVVVPMEELLVNFADPETKIVLPSLTEPPNQTIPAERLDALAERSLEWMRYYRCFQLETWNRDVTISIYLHFGMSERTLYLEWTPCILFPIAQRYRVVDRTPVEPLAPLRNALLEWVQLPGALLFRLPSLFRRIRPVRNRPGMVQPWKYGARWSLRELASARELQNYFQRSDVSRYLQVTGRRMIRAIGEFLEQRDIASNDFMTAARAVIDQQFYIYGNVTNSAIGDNATVFNQGGPTN